MQRFETIQEEFEHLKKQDINDYEAKIEVAKEAKARSEERSKVIAKRLYRVTKKHNMDLSELHSIYDDEDEFYSKYLTEIRAKLLDRSSQAQSDLKIKAMYAPALNTSSIENVKLLGSLMLAPDIRHFEDIKGERGNPWLTPDDNEFIHIGQKYTGSGTGSGCWNIGYIYSPDCAHIYFHYMPPKTGNIFIQAWSILHGFYIARANDGCFTCKMAKTYAKMQIDTCQNGIWQSGDSFKICDIDDDNVDTYGIIDKGILLETSRLVLSNAPVTIRVSIYVGTLAKGSGSYAEVDFKSKAKNGSELNYIRVPCVAVGYK